MRFLVAALFVVSSLVSAQAANHHRYQLHRRIVIHDHSLDAGHFVAHPAGCPASLFCGCGVSVRVFGHPVRSLWSAAAWYRFPRATAAPGTVAIFGRHHVAYIEAVYGDGTALLYDPNSGGRATRVHRRSLSGLQIVRPS
jgi:hypothetical protein